MFNAIARRYDLGNCLLSLGLDRRWRRKAVAMLRPRDSGRYLDVGCGTGDVALEILRQCPGAAVVGIDRSEEMLAVGRQKVAAAGLGGAIELRLGDAMELDFPADAFDGAISAFCIRNVERRARAFAEMGRAVAPGGPVVVMEVSQPACPVVRAGHWLYIHTAVPLVGRLVARSGPSYRYLVASIEYFPRPDEVLAAMEEGGLRDAGHVGLLAGTAVVFHAIAP